MVIRAEELDQQTSTPQSPNVQRRSGVDSPRIWMGREMIEPGKESGAHHHGEAESGSYVFSGKLIVLWGKNFENQVEAEPGDFVHIPPHVPHIERNASPTEPVVLITARKPGNIVVNLESEEEIRAAQERPDLKEVSVTKAAELDKQTDQTHNLPRKTGIHAPNLWMGRVTGEPGGDSGAHHHGEAETAGFILSGTTTILYGDQYEQSVHLKKGDFVYVPPFAKHIERNLSSEPVVFITARNPENIVVNLN
jgi:uncharacterized RmlC-like cupin family protein